MTTTPHTVEIPAAEPDIVDVSDAVLDLMPRADGVELFKPFNERFSIAVQKAADLEIRPDDSPEEQSRKSGLAKRMRIDDFKKTRLAAKELHGKLKKGILEITRKLDGAERDIREKCAAQEEKLEAIEKHAERMEQDRIDAARAAREAELLPLLPAGFIVPDLGKMTEAQYATQLSEARQILDMKKQLAAMQAEAEEREAREAAERKAREEVEAAERKAREEVEAAERKAREEVEAAERKAREEVEAAERKAREEEDRKARAEAAAREAEARARADAAEAEAKRLRDEASARESAAAREREEAEAAARRAAAAPDAEKLRAFAAGLQRIGLPALSDTKEQELLCRAADEFIRFINARAAKLVA